MEHPGLRLAPVWDAGITDGCLTRCATTLAALLGSVKGGSQGPGGGGHLTMEITSAQGNHRWSATYLGHGLRAESGVQLHPGHLEAQPCPLRPHSQRGQVPTTPTCHAGLSRDLHCHQASFPPAGRGPRT